MFDWEDCLDGGLPLFDLFHFQYFQFYIAGKECDPAKELKNMPDYPEYARSIKINETIYEKLLLYYLALKLVENIDSGGNPSHGQFFLKEIVSRLQTK